MKRIFTLLLICCSAAAMAQMQAAKKIIPDYTHETIIKSSPVKIWRVIRNLSQVKDYSNGMIKDVQITGEGDSRVREITFTDNTKRKDAIEQVHESYKFFVFSIVSPLPTGITHATVTALVESMPDKDDTAVVRWSIILEGDKGSRKPLVDTLSTEIANYETGLKKMLE
ncbi:hypothetical protein HGH93_10615 [Chitinophaga polysaccharea]|uniref:hypothetical protein n=1 Tax=Chitinophaga TaxID=79328 RepID=UPI001455D1BD|nr:MULTISPECIES: hypothetical protein [Chitinophaga]NLR58555.1 hypothetical protein [Chitinophaga polysaccharea]NLU91083.1 hypothetical protein [Chitinophaga sp. Ak27]